jgi:hypothetical protein
LITIHMIGKKPKAAPSVLDRSAWPTGISNRATATTRATPSEISPDSQARIRKPPRRMKRVKRGIEPHIALRASDPPTGSRSC